LDRKEAVALLKQLAALKLIQPFLVALKENRHGKFDLIVKGDCDIQGLRDFVSERNLMLKEDVKKGYCIIAKFP
jgi:hypothetical protein